MSEVMEGWSEKYKRSINCNNPKGFSQKAHCAGKKKNEDTELDEFDVAAAKEKAKAANQARIKQDAERSQNRKDIRDKLKNIKRTV